MYETEKHKNNILYRHLFILTDLEVETRTKAESS